MCPRWPSRAFIVSSVVVQLPGRPRLLQWMCTGCGSFSSSTAWATRWMICRGVTPKWSTGVVEVVDVARLLALPDLDAAGIDELGGVALGGASSQPTNALQPLAARRCWIASHDVMVVAHQDVEALVDAGRVGEFLVGVPGGERRDGGVEGRRVAQAGVLVAGGERAGHAAHRAAVRDGGAADRLGLALFLGPHLAGRC